jgi:hypothetical protein
VTLERLRSRDRQLLVASRTPGLPAPYAHDDDAGRRHGKVQLRPLKLDSGSFQAAVPVLVRERPVPDPSGPGLVKVKTVKAHVCSSSSSKDRNKLTKLDFTIRSKKSDESVTTFKTPNVNLFKFV